jgi:hypothetical protein
MMERIRLLESRNNLGVSELNTFSTLEEAQMALEARLLAEKQQNPPPVVQSLCDGVIKGYSLLYYVRNLGVTINKIWLESA